MTAQRLDDDPLPVVVQRWRRYAHDRAYVKVDGWDAGYRDLKTGEVVCIRDDMVDTVAQATSDLLERVRGESTRYLGRHAAPEQVPGPTPTPTPSLLGLQPDRDLALSPPGRAARQQATALRDAAPVRTFVARVTGAKTDERSWRIGADAEEEVARRLSKLGPEWKVLHAVPIGDRGRDIDHVVIGPAGVFTINTKHHPQAKVWVGGDVVKVNGHNQPYVRNSRFEARRAAELLSARAQFDLDVKALIVVMGAHGGFTVKAQPADGQVAVIARRTLTTYLQSLPPMLAPGSIVRIYEVARHLATWQPKTVRWEALD